ncbi:hypothetical protein Pcinc_004890 [Petrolisthes cinctipes]|uniref:Uncharacterized protein n=1 Tax=Petrolisthes cinctipes TaxID=88211 RepID=A0AAE1GEM4_PETCI|nr:hypothetical protein Pcinc_004890 [Petrolisthes cinctipes]
MEEIEAQVGEFWYKQGISALKSREIRPLLPLVALTMALVEDIRDVPVAVRRRECDALVRPPSVVVDDPVFIVPVNN